MNIIIIDKDTVSVDGNLFKRAEISDILICTIDGYQYFLGPEFDGEMEWAAAKRWCESLGEGYELPNRLVMLALCMNEVTAEHLTDHAYYWTSSELEENASQAWLQHWHSSSPGYQGNTSKSTALRIRAVRRSKAIEQEQV